MMTSSSGRHFVIANVNKIEYTIISLTKELKKMVPYTPTREELQ